ncbi:hypothetical protein SELMODRAFT_444336 [Selaginella moellendorffii]|uniref:Uncharacterized protein n=1 Tax=Selaginella moellendorffii TaxID=88036 RepID=D8S947_SELML|nr:hypothetical protein SELMODRAFT_444336 [Selaginella moellendorffii]
MDAGSHSHYRACWNVAFSSIDTVIAPLVGVDLQHHFAVLDGSAQIPVFWLGKLCFSTISDRVRSLSDNLCKTMRQWSINLLVQVLFSGMVMLNPRLSEAQQFQLLSAITRALEQLFLQHWLDERLMKGLIALACPDRGSRILVTLSESEHTLSLMVLKQSFPSQNTGIWADPSSPAKWCCKSGTINVSIRGEGGTITID